MAITAAPGWKVDPNNPNAVIQDTAPNPTSTNISYGAVNTNPTSQPAAAVTQPAPQITSPTAPTAPTTNTTGTTGTTTQGTQTGTAPAMLSPQQLTPEQVKQYYASQSTATSPLSPAQWLAQQDKYNAAHEAAKGDAAPQSRDEFNQSDIAQGLQETGEQKDPFQAMFDAMGQMDPVTKSIFDYMNSAISTAGTRTSLVDEFKNFYRDEIGPLNTEMLDINRIMDGTEDDIRDEITSAGGFGTESQIQAMTMARNKTLLKRATQLQAAIDQKQDYIKQIVDLTGMDREAVEKDVDRKLGLAGTVLTTYNQMQTAAKSSYNEVVKNVGYKGLSSALMGNAKALADAEKTLGLAKGALSNQSFLSLMDTEDKKPYQFVSGTENQASGYFDPNTGKFSAYGGGGGGGSGTSGGGPNSPYQDAFNNASIGLGPQTLKSVKPIFDAYIQKGDYDGARDYITSLAINRAPAEQQSRLVGRAGGIAALDDIQGLIMAAKAKGANLNFATGTMVELAQKLGETPDPDLSYIGARMKMAVQDYRRAMSGVAFSEPESKEYKSIMPDLYSVEGLNLAKIAAARDAFNANNRALLSTYMGGNRTYDALYGAPKASVLPSQTTPKIPTGAIMITRNGQKGYISSMLEFDPKTDKRI